MTEEEILKIIESKRSELAIDPDMEFTSAERAIVQYKDDRNTPGPTEDRLAWTIRYSCEWGFIEIHIDGLTGKILRIRRSV